MFENFGMFEVCNAGSLHVGSKTIRSLDCADHPRIVAPFLETYTLAVSERSLYCSAALKKPCIAIGYF